LYAIQCYVPYRTRTKVHCSFLETDTRYGRQRGRFSLIYFIVATIIMNKIASIIKMHSNVLCLITITFVLEQFIELSKELRFYSLASKTKKNHLSKNGKNRFEVVSSQTLTNLV